MRNPFHFNAQATPMRRPPWANQAPWASLVPWSSQVPWASQGRICVYTLIATLSATPLTNGQSIATDPQLSTPQPSFETEYVRPDDPPDNERWFGLSRASIDDNLITDRPDFTESTEAIPVGRFQLEMGYTFTYDREDDVRVRDHTAPELLLRMGIVENFELRFGWAGYSYTETRDTVRNTAGRRVSDEVWDQGSNDFELGLKLKIAEQDGVRPNLAILAGMTFPTGSSNISPGDVEPLAGLLWAYDLSDDIALAGQFLVGTPVEDGRRYVQSAASLSLGVSLTERLGTYLEYYGIYHNTRESDCAHTVNGGFTYLINNNLQVDIRAGFGLNEEADDFLAGAGLSWRF